MKKALFAAFALFASTSALAVGPSDSWDAIRASYDYNVSAVIPALGPAGIFNACATDSELRSLTPVKVCVETKYIPGHGEFGGETVCVREESRTVTVARHGVSAVCTKWAPINEGSYGECLAWENRPYEIGLTHAVEVTFARGEMYGELAFVKNYTIPACK